jgi:hypothetical protein
LREREEEEGEREKNVNAPLGRRPSFIAGHLLHFFFLFFLYAAIGHIQSRPSLIFSDVIQIDSTRETETV